MYSINISYYFNFDYSQSTGQKTCARPRAMRVTVSAPSWCLCLCPPLRTWENRGDGVWPKFPGPWSLWELLWCWVGRHQVSQTLGAGSTVSQLQPWSDYGRYEEQTDNLEEVGCMPPSLILVQVTKALWADPAWELQTGMKLKLSLLFHLEKLFRDCLESSCLGSSPVSWI
jgi:hypothetical protein